MIHYFLTESYICNIYYEERWLLTSQDGLSATEVSSIEQVLWNHRVGETILRAGQKSVDVGSFSTLVGERYLDNFVIDAAIFCLIFRMARTRWAQRHSIFHLKLTLG